MPTETLIRPETEGVFSASDIEEWNQEFAHLSIAERIEESYRRLGGRLIAASSFGPTAPPLLKDISETELDVPVVNVRHHHETLKTLRLISQYQQEFDLDLRVYEAKPLPIPRRGSLAFKEFQHEVKIVPFQRALDELQPRGFITGQIRWQSERRRELPFVESKGDVLAINPAADVSKQEIEDFFDETGYERDENYVDPTKGLDNECRLNITEYRLGAVACLSK